MLKPVMNLISSMAKTLVGQPATVSEAPSGSGAALVTLRDFKRNQFHHRGIDLEEGQIDRRNAILAGEKVGNVLVPQQSELYQRRAQTTLVSF